MQRFILLSVTAFFAFAAAVAQDETLQQFDTVPAISVGDERLRIETKDKEESPAAKGLKLEKEIKPRLPNGFGPLVDTTQREKIYNIQREYNGLIALLELRLELLKKERDAKVDAVLTPAQLQRLNRPARRLSVQ